MASFHRTVDVVLPRPVHGSFTYYLSDDDEVSPGCMVIVPLGRAVTIAYVIAVQEPPGNNVRDLKTVLRVLDPDPVINQELMALLRSVSEYYQVALGWLMKNALPPGLAPEEIKMVSLTDKGRDVLHQPGENVLGTGSGDQAVDNRFLAVLKYLENINKPVPLRMLGDLPATDLVVSGHLLKKMEKSGVIISTYRIEETNATPGQPYYRFRVSPSELRVHSQAINRTAAKKAAMYEFLISLSETSSPFTARELNKQFPGASRHLSTLVMEGILEPLSQIDAQGRFMELENSSNDHVILTADQQRVIDTVTGSISDGFHTFLLHGVTGSGKTEVYLRLAAKVLEAGKDVILLVPEIGLTPVMISRTAARFPGQFAVLHSGLDRGERLQQWLISRSRAPKVVLGTRSAIFAPVPGPGLIIVDEEHDSSYKQSNNPAYHGRDVAILRGFLAGIPVLLGSATPSLESYYNASTKKYQLLTMPRRIDDHPLPPVRIIDMRKKHREAGTSLLLSPDMVRTMTQCLEQREQIMLFVDRRGYSNFMICKQCGYVPRCDRCSVSLTLHRAGNKLKCHYCDRTMILMNNCPECNAEDMQGMGLGTQTVEEEVQRLFPTARSARLDTDSAKGKKVSRILAKVSRGEIDILIGTQMITKGHDFHNVTLVGVISADTSLYLADFRASERTFQLLTQVAGRTGRGIKPGQVIIQTYNPLHHGIVCATRHDYAGFYEQEIKNRRGFRFPPFVRMAALLIVGRDQPNVITAVKALHRTLKDHPASIEIIGPSPAPLAKLRNEYRWHILIKGTKARTLGDFIRESVTRFQSENRFSSIRLQIDIDPLFLL